jgi:hypothetical protein
MGSRLTTGAGMRVSAPATPPAPILFSPTEQPPVLLLIDAVLALTAYRRELQRAGYPFREPERATAAIKAITEYCFED